MNRGRNSSTSQRSKNSTANIVLDGEKSTAFPQRSRTKQRCPLSLLLGILASAIRQGKEIREVQIRMEEKKFVSSCR